MSVEYEFHTLAMLFPKIVGERFESLVASIKANGVRIPIVIYQGKILDGVNRYLATKELGVECPTQVYEGDDPLTYVADLNLQQRDLTYDERKKIAAAMTNLGHGSNQHKAKVEPPVGGSSEEVAPVSAKAAATKMHVSQRSVERERAKQKAEASPEVNKSVEAGTMSLRAAVNTLKPDTRKDVLADVIARRAKKDMRTDVYKALKRTYDTMLKDFTALQMERDSLLAEKAKHKDALREVVAENMQLKEKVKASTLMIEQLRRRLEVKIDHQLIDELNRKLAEQAAEIEKLTKCAAAKAELIGEGAQS
ncbi:ParB N-terminal domain-containing protein [Pseudomonas sp. R5(2019)]|uniref:ParB N-terminal domain-containing protein n=1 Tax=Pseudomonas sp. R5(2019) TaxID=2697566 RepID=UPI001413570D|nr:ParB N-terminal domain-containing protein [Pseudomonas sp. R5(2019)]NBA93447.1 ParB N-terminal domain-containing protein [Pseudomonas sp. R5(2019)]